jgi:type IV secretion system protein VirB5
MEGGGDMDNKKMANPYIAARNEWNEVYGSYIKQRNVMVIITLCSLAITIIAVIGVVYIGGQSKFIPYVVEVDKLGRSVGAGIARQASPTNEKNIKAQLSDFVMYVRSVTTDARVQKQWLLKAYSMMGRNDPSANYIKGYFGAGTGPKSPFLRAETETVEINVSTILALSGQSWEVEWTETIRDNEGTVIDTLLMRGVFQIYISVPETEEDILSNPSGVFVKSVSWSEKL